MTLKANSNTVRYEPASHLVWWFYQSWILFQKDFTIMFASPLLSSPLLSCLKYINSLQYPLFNTNGVLLHSFNSHTHTALD